MRELIVQEQWDPSLVSGLDSQLLIEGRKSHWDFGDERLRE
jgi:hypothetical protein